MTKPVICSKIADLHSLIKVFVIRCQSSIKGVSHDLYCVRVTQPPPPYLSFSPF